MCLSEVREERAARAIALVGWSSGMKINLDIERLVLDGVPIDHHDAPLVQTAVEGELTRLLDAEELRSRLNVISGATPRVTAEQITRAVHGSITQ